MSDARRAALALATASFFFGTTFVVVQDAVAEVEPVPFLAVRFLVGAALLAPFAVRRRARGPAPLLGRAGLTTGGVLVVAYVLQTVGLQHTTTQVSAFLTYLLVVFVPLMAAVAHRRRPSRFSVGAVVLAVAGVAALTGGRVGFGLGEVLTLGCAVAFAAHILMLEHWAPRLDLVRLNAAQLGVVGVGLAVPGWFFGGYDFTTGALLAAVYTGAMASALAFGLQLYGQRHLDATRVSLLLLLEPVFAAALGHATGERLGAWGAVGAGLIFAAILLTEVWEPLTKRSRVGEGDPDERPPHAPSSVRPLGPA